MAANTYDAIVIGGGHNGLVAAAYLARSGARVVVCEARHKVGGAAATDAPWPEAPEFKVTTYSYVMSLMPSEIIHDLELERHGYRIHPMGPYYVAFPDGGSLTIGQIRDSLLLRKRGRGWLTTSVRRARCASRRTRSHSRHHRAIGRGAAQGQR